MADNELNTRFDILEGPSKFDLMSALFDGKLVDFTIKVSEKKQRISVNIISVGLEDGSRQSWLIKGYFAPPAYHSPAPHFDGFYQSKRRQGWLRRTK